MTYKDYLDFANSLKDPYKMLVAVELKYYVEEFEFEYDDEDFENMCELVYEYFLEQDDNISTPTSIAYELKEILFEDRLYNVEEIEIFWDDIKEEIRKRLE